ncbi:MAG: 4-hydroxy-tetrahydrodipicolinate reductase [Candidatus Cloacimonetes bacterium]|jgi:4-hydroxy-tetrahydrodipicolinate reductase|nr:4-hydroxy-tetrahydrodipicolinate reductase [Candidatus Cloacimonadota bacterium]MDD4157488.1 4-hydroxy-tetrahydrodipicolinate reductase [Candidatus Cloacimonadota bacterium]
MSDVRKIKILLIGYGNMGHIIENEAISINCDIIDIIEPKDNKYNKTLDNSKINECDAIIEFTHPIYAFNIIDNALKYNKPVISGTTGWFHKIEELKKKHNFTTSTLIYGSNYSIGMNLFYQIINYSSKLIGDTNLYDIYGIEAHHKKKADSPSGTAKILSEIILNTFQGKEKVRYDLNNQALETNEFSFTSIRAGEISGKHQIGFDSIFDEIEIKHSAKSRRGFAIGALMAARYACKIKGIHNFKDIFSEVMLNATQSH